MFKLAVIVCELYTALHLSTYPANCGTSGNVCCLDTEAGCAHQPPVFSMSARRDLSLSAITYLLLLARVSGTVYLLTSSLFHHSQHFVRN